MKQTTRRAPSHKIRTPEEIEAAEVRRKQKERERNRKARERLKAAQTASDGQDRAGVTSLVLSES